MIIANRFTHGVLHRFYTNAAMGYAYYKVWPLVQATPRPAFVPSIAPTQVIDERAAAFIAPPTHYGRGCGLGTTGETLHNRESEMCGLCGHKFGRHSEECDRDSESLFGSYLHDYYQYGQINYDRTPRTYIVPYEDYAGYPEDEDEHEFTRQDELDYMYESEGGYDRQDFYWQDGKPSECTTVLEVAGAPTVKMNDGSELNMYVDTSAIEAQSKTVFVEGIAGYHSIKLLDLFITAKSHAKMLNVYRKDGVLRIGGLTLFPKQEHEEGFGITWTEVTARCGHHGCRYQDERRNWKQRTFTLGGYELSRSQMEDFVYSLIRHGNNHAAPWFHDRTVARATRKALYSSSQSGLSVSGLTPWKIEIPKDTPTFYKVHEFACDLTCDPTQVVCAV